jgi:hypothetical protein
VGFFSRRRKKESAIPEADEPALGSFATAEGQPVIGQQVGGGMPGGVNVQGLDAGDAMAMFSQIGPAIQQAIASGNVQITQGQPEVIDMRGSGLREQIMGIMQEHGIDPENPGAQATVDASAYGNMQQQILEALSQHGVNPNPAQANPQDYAQMQQELMAVLAKHGINPGSPSA